MFSFRLSKLINVVNTKVYDPENCELEIQNLMRLYMIDEEIPRPVNVAKLARVAYKFHYKASTTYQTIRQ